MSQPASPSDESVEATPEFPPTRWSAVNRAGSADTRVAAEALETLGRAYQYPLYAFLRRSGYSTRAARAWRLAFFQDLLDHRTAAQAGPEKGRFRVFLLAALKRFIAAHKQKSAEQKEAGGRVLTGLNDAADEERYAREPDDNATPETLFELSWARTVQARAAASLEKEYVAAGRKDDFARLKLHLQAGRAGASYAESAAALGWTEASVEAGVKRLRQRSLQLFRAHIAEIVENPSEVEDELRHLRAVLTG